MLTVFFLWGYVTALLYVYGILTIKCIDKLFPQKTAQQFPSFSVITIVGLCTLSVFTGVFSLFSNVGLLAHFLILSGGIFYMLWERQTFRAFVSTYKVVISKSNSLTFFLFFVPSLVVLLVSSATPVIHGDTGLYHAQSVKWIEEYGTIPGLANIHGRFAFNTSWHFSVALFSLSFLKIQPFFVLNGLFFVIAILFALEGVNRLFQGDYCIENKFKAALYPLLLLFFLFNKQYIVFLNSLSPDFQAIFFVLLIFCLFAGTMPKDTTPSTNFDRNSVLILFLALFVVTIKLSTVPVLALPLFLLGKKIKNIQKEQVYSIAGLTFLTFFPWILRYYILSGYLIYPFPAIDIFNPDWKVPLPTVIHEKIAVESWARIQNTDLDNVLSMPFVKWSPIWFQNLQVLEKGLAIWIFSISLWYAFYGLFTIRKATFFSKTVKEYAPLYVTAYTGVLFWFCTAPDFRFGYGFLMILGILLFLPISPQMEKLFLFMKKNYKPFILLIFLFIAFEGNKIHTAYKNSDALQNLFNLEVLKKRVLFPSDYPHVEIEKVALKNFTVQVPVSSEKNLCWNVPLPCTPYPNKNVEMRGDEIEDGFRVNSK